MNPQCIFYKTNAEISQDIIWITLNYAAFLPFKKDLSALTNYNIGEVIVLYIVMMIKITKDKSMVHIIALFAIYSKST